MTAVLLWKEYRQQRSIWISIAILGGLLVLTFTLVMTRGREQSVANIERLRATVEMTVLCLTVAYGVISGALLLAGERDEGTEVFLDSLCSWRGPVWERKVMAGVLFTFSQSAVLAGLAMVFGLWETAIALPFMGLAALGWGLLGGALSRTALTGVMTGIGMLGVSWLLFSVAKFILAVVVCQAAAGMGATLLSQRIFCRDDRLRRPVRKRSTAPASERVQHRIQQLRLEIEWLLQEEEASQRQTVPVRAEKVEQQSPGPAKRKMASKLASEWRVLWWLVLRQGRWFLGAALPAALLLSLIVHHSPLYFWPIGMLFMGVAFGVAAFAPDQNDGSRFLATQRFPVGMIWNVKVLVWTAVVLLMTLVTWFIATEAIFTVPILNMLLPTGAGGPARRALTAAPMDWIKNCMGWGSAPGVVDAVLLVVIWPLYGFSFGLLYGQLMRRPVLGAMQAAAVTPFVAGVWVPSLAVGGVSAWQVLLVPLVLIVTTRFTMRPWLAGRLRDRRPLLGIVASATAIPLLVAACLWHRAIEVPDVGEPFDVKAFVDSLPTTENNEANTLIRSARKEMSTLQYKVMKEMSAGIKEQPERGEPDVEFQLWLENPFRFGPELGLAFVWGAGWPENDKQIVRWLDRLFAGEWPVKVQKAAGMRLGMLQDPRFPDQSGLDHDLIQMTNLLALRALQLQAQDNSRGGLKQLETLLALTRHVRHLATNDRLRLGVEMETVAVTTCLQWLQGVGPDKALLRESLAMLERHEAALPDPAGSIKADYLAYPLDPDVLWPALWEKERQACIRNAVVAGLLREINKPYWKTGIWASGKNGRGESPSPSGLETGLPLESGPGSNLSAAQWEEYVSQSWRYGNTSPFYVPRDFMAASQQSIRAAQLVTALALYQAEKGHPPSDLADLIGRDYMNTLPVNPYDGEKFKYVIFKAGDPQPFSQRPLVPGQAFIWIQVPCGFIQVPPGFQQALAAPVWEKK